MCDTCGSAFTKASSLVKHNRIHSGDRPYPCEMCDMRFTCSDHLKRHKRTHTGEKRELNFVSPNAVAASDSIDELLLHLPLQPTNVNIVIEHLLKATI